MANGVRPWAIGRNISILITPQSRNASTGAFSDHSVGQLNANVRWSENDSDISYAQENLSPTYSFNGNPVINEQSASFSLSEMVTTEGDSGSVKIAGSVIRRALLASFYQKIVAYLYADDGTIMEKATYYVIVTAGPSRGGRKGGVTDSASFATVDLRDLTTGAAIANPLIEISPAGTINTSTGVPA